ncbi:MAG: HlyC/CorC family transporter [Nitrospirae bacterium]|nr:HlyC/CorC family transporter [Nitrospirota bacterium]
MDPANPANSLFYVEILILFVCLMGITILSAIYVTVFSSRSHGPGAEGEAEDVRGRVWRRVVRDAARFHYAAGLLELILIVTSAGIIVQAAIGSGSFRWTVLSLAVWIAIVSVLRALSRAVALREPYKTGVRYAYLARGTIVLMSPLTWAVERGTQAVLRLAAPPRGEGETAAAAGERIPAGEIRAELAPVTESEQRVLGRIREFGEARAVDVMVPRTEVAGIPAGATVKEALELARETASLWNPVVEESIDNVVGMVSAADLALQASLPGGGDGTIQPLVQPAFFIPENKRLSELVGEMRAHPWPLAIILDEYGGTAGMVTRERLIAELAERFRGEEGAAEEVEVVDERNIVVSGQASLEEVNEAFSTEMRSDDFQTIGGYVFGLFGRIPRAGETVKFRDLKFEVLEVSGRRIGRIKIGKA